MPVLPDTDLIRPLNDPMQMMGNIQQLQNGKMQQQLMQQKMDEANSPEARYAKASELAKVGINYVDSPESFEELKGHVGRISPELGAQIKDTPYEQLGAIRDRMYPKQAADPLLAERRDLLNAQADAARANAGKSDRWENPQPRAGQGNLGGGNAERPPNLPVPALKLENEEADMVNAGNLIVNNTQGLIDNIDSGKLDLGPLKNLKNKGRNLMGMSNDQSVNLSVLNTNLEKMRADSLRLNKGPQTDGDAEREFKTLMENITDPVVVKTQLLRIQELNKNAAKWHASQANNIRANFGAKARYENLDSLNNNSTALSNQDAAAKHWAQMNPNDPRAQAIMERLQGR